MTTPPETPWQRLLRKLREAFSGPAEVGSCADRSGLVEQDDDLTPTDAGVERD